mmetsp:Transcript_34068/g.98209  ORF Transcript_34068/g.98209 Transcript_34068/m.98209 type:complete len:230 (-) Transcript_34068:165-854(-)
MSSTPRPLASAVGAWAKASRSTRDAKRCLEYRGKFVRSLAVTMATCLLRPNCKIARATRCPNLWQTRPPMSNASTSSVKAATEGSALHCSISAQTTVQPEMCADTAAPSPKSPAAITGAASRGATCNACTNATEAREERAICGKATSPPSSRRTCAGVASSIALSTTWQPKMSKLNVPARSQTWSTAASARAPPARMSVRSWRTTASSTSSAAASEASGATWCSATAAL